MLRWWATYGVYHQLPTKKKKKRSQNTKNNGIIEYKKS